MRPWTIPILGAVALSLALPSNAEARLRFGPAAVLGVLAAGAMFGGFRHSSRHHRHSAMHSSVGRRSARVARIERWRAAVGEPRPEARTPAEPTAALPPERTAPVSPEQAAPISSERTAAIFWPDAAADLVDYVLFPKGNDRFWAHGYDSIVYAAFAASDLDDPRTKRSRPAANQVSDAAPPAKAPLSSADLCGTISAAADADALIERIERAIGPSASQRDVLEQLRASLVQAIERINATCPALVPATFTERLNAIQDRIWIMHDALLTLRLPLENFYNSLTDEQQRRLRRDEPKSGESRANVTDGRAQTCVEPAVGIADGIMRAIGRAAPPSEPQRAGVETLRLNSAAMAKLIAGSCPTDPLLGPMGRFAAATDRLDGMLFAVMSMSPALQQVYNSLDDKQKAGLHPTLRQVGRSGRYAATTNGPGQRAAEVCSNRVPELTDWPIERISEVVQPTDAQRPALDELRTASAKAIEILQSGCPKDLPSIPTGRLAAMESRLQVMLAAVQTVRPALERFYESLSDEQKARFNAIAPARDADAAGKDQRDLTKFCDEKAPGVTDLPIDRIGQAVQPTSAQRAALDELKDASVKAAEGLKVSCPVYQMLTPTGRVEAMEKRLAATLGVVKTVQPALAKFYNLLSDEQKARFNSLRSASRPAG